MPAHPFYRIVTALFMLIVADVSSIAQITEQTVLSLQCGYQRYLVRSKAGMFGIVGNNYRTVLYDLETLNAVHENISNVENTLTIPTCAAVSDDGQYVAFGEDGGRIFIESIRDEKIVDTLSIAPRRWGQWAMHLFDRENLLVVCEDLNLQKQVLVRVIDGAVRYTCPLPQFGDRIMDVHDGIVGIVDQYNTVLLARLPESDTLSVLSKFNYIQDYAIDNIAILDGNRVALQYGNQRIDVLDIVTGRMLTRLSASSFSYDPVTHEMYTLEGRTVVVRDDGLKEIRRITVEWNDVDEVFADRSGVAYMLFDGTIVGPHGRVRNLPFNFLLDFQASGERCLFRDENEVCYTEPESIVRHRVGGVAAVALNDVGYAYSTNDTVIWFPRSTIAPLQRSAPAQIAAMTFYGDSVLYLVALDGTIFRMTAASETAVRMAATGISERALRAEVSPGEDYMIVKYAYGETFVRFAENASSQWAGFHTFLDEEGKYAGLVNDGTFAYVIEVATNTRTSEFYTQRSRRLAGLSGVSKMLTMFTRDSAIAMWDLVTGKELYDMRRYIYPIRLWSQPSTAYVYTLNQVVHSFTRTGTTGIVPVPSVALSIYPNPSTGVFHFGSPHPNSTIKVYDLMGRIVAIAPPGAADIELVNPGVYHVVLYNQFGGVLNTARAVVRP